MGASSWRGRRAAWRKSSPPRPTATPTLRFLAAFDYLAMVWALLASLAVDGQAPSIPVLIGAAAITGAGLLALTERRFQTSQKFVIPNKIV